MPLQHQSFPSSGALASASYDDQTQTLTVTFKNSAQSYTYPNVPADTWEQFQSADSPGRFWRDSIKDQYG